MRRALAGIAVAVAVGATVLPATSASACDPNYDPSCNTPCVTVRRYWNEVDRYVSDGTLPPRPIC